VLLGLLELITTRLVGIFFLEVALPLDPPLVNKKDPIFEENSGLIRLCVLDFGKGEIERCFDFIAVLNCLDVVIVNLCLPFPLELTLLVEEFGAVETTLELELFPIERGKEEFPTILDGLREIDRLEAEFCFFPLVAFRSLDEIFDEVLVGLVLITLNLILARISLVSWFSLI